MGIAGHFGQANSDQGNCGERGFPGCGQGPRRVVSRSDLLVPHQDPLQERWMVRVEQLASAFSGGFWPAWGIMKLGLDGSWKLGNSSVNAKLQGRLA